MLHSIRWRLIVSYTLLTLLTVTLLGVTVLSLLQRYIDQQEEDHLRVNAEALARQAESLMAWKVPDMRLLDLARTAAILGDFQVRILDRKQQIIADSGDPESLQQFSWFVPKLNAISVEALPPGSVMVWQDEPSDSQLPPLPPAKFSDAIFVSDTVDSAVTVVRQSPSLWGPIIEFAVISKEKSLKEADQTFGVIASAKGVGVGGVALAGSLAVTHDVLITQTVASVRSTKVVSSPIANPIGLLGYVELSQAPSFGSEALSAVWRLFALAAAGVSLLAAALGLFVGRGLTAPLQELRAVTAKMNTGNLATRAAIGGQDEIAGLAHDFNQMAAALEESFASLAAERDALRRFIADASHELRTPITALRSFNELLLGAAEADPAVRHEFLQEGQGQIKRLERITDSLINLSRLEGGLVALKCETHPVSELIQNVLSNFKRIAQEREITLSASLPSPALSVHCDSQQLESALGNLVDNALKFTAPKGEVQIGAAVGGVAGEPPTVLLWVKDNGAGIAAAEMPLIFDRFHRGSNAAYAGSGLGLAIVKRIIDMHKGTIEVLSEPGQGAQFFIRLPM